MSPVAGSKIIRTLEERGIDTIFGIPGHQTQALNDVLLDDTDDSDDVAEDDDIGVNFVMARHETAVSYQAWGYVETSDRMAATLVVPGPGELNASNGLKNALNDGTPLLHLTVETDPAIRGGDAIHEIPPETYDTVVKANRTVRAGESVIDELHRSISIARTAPTGPVRLGIPDSFIADDSGTPETGTPRTSDGMPSPSGAVEVHRGSVLTSHRNELAEIVERLTASDRPLIVAGGGIRRSGASESLRAFAERFSIPVLTTTVGRGKGTFPEDHQLWAGPIFFGSAEFVEAADLLLAVGTDLDAVTTDHWQFDIDGYLAQVVLHPNDLWQGYQPDSGIVGDAGAVLDALASALPDSASPSEDAWVAIAETRRRELENRIARMRDTNPSERMNSADVISAVRRILPDDCIVAGDAGGLGMWMRAGLTISSDQSYLQPGSWASMGAAVPGAIGAKCANPDRPVLAMVGDGGLMMAIHELHTLVAEDIPVVVLVTNNSEYRIISAGDGPEYEWRDSPLDFTSIADGMGLEAEKAASPQTLESVARESIARGEPKLVEVPTRPGEKQAATHLTDGEQDSKDDGTGMYDATHDQLQDLLEETDD